MILDTLIEIVDTPSETGNEGRLCTSLAERMMRTHGQDGVARINNSLVVGRRTDRPLILLVGHIDTVPNQGQGAAFVDGDRVHGLGTSDMKAGVAVMVHLLEDAGVILGPYDVVGIFYEKEEGPADDNGTHSRVGARAVAGRRRLRDRHRANRSRVAAWVCRGDQRHRALHREGRPQRPAMVLVRTP